MYKYIFEIKDRKYEELSKEENHLDALIEQNILCDEVPEFYSDQEAFIKKYTKGHSIKTHKKLFLVQTDQRGWDTYDSAVFCAWTEKEALELTIRRMGQDYEHSTVKEIGKANKDLEVGEVVSSFNAG